MINTLEYQCAWREFSTHSPEDHKVARQYVELPSQLGHVGESRYVLLVPLRHTHQLYQAS
jgi:hypothetical protein